MKGPGKKDRAVKWLGLPDEKIYSFQEALLYAVLHFAASSLAIFAAVDMLVTVWNDFGLSKKSAVLLGAELLCCSILYEIALPALAGLLKKKERWLRLAIIAAGIWLWTKWLVSIYWKTPLELEDGFLMLGSSYLEKYNQFHHTAFTMDRGLQIYVSDALTLVLSTLIFVFGNLTYAIKKSGFWMFLPWGMGAVMLMAGISPCWRGIVFSSVSFYLFCSADTVGRIGICVDAKGRIRKRNVGRELAGRGLVVCALTLFLGGISLVAQKPAESVSISSKTSRTIRSILLKQTGEGEGDDLQFDFLGRAVEISNKRPDYKDRQIFRITADGSIQSNLYFKDFQGMLYQNGKWICKDSLLRSFCIKDDVDQEKLQHLLNEGCRQIWEEAKRYPGGSEIREFSIRYQAAAGDCYPMPYFVNTAEYKAGELSGDVRIKRKFLQNKREFSAVNGNLFSVTEIEALSGRILSPREKELWSWYDEYAAKKYLTVPEGIPAVYDMAEAVGPLKKWQDPNLGRVYYANEVAELLSGFAYSWDLEKLEKGTDPIEYFLTKGKKGYCVHFASAGVMILRALGIPTRYAEGYIVKQQAFEEGEGGAYVTQVIDRNRHAWAEIYLDHIGWIPVEMTPGYSEPNAELQTDAEAEKHRQEREKGQQDASETETQGESEEKEETNFPEPEKESQETEFEETDPGETENGETENGETENGETDTPGIEGSGADFPVPGIPSKEPEIGVGISGEDNGAQTGGTGNMGGAFDEGNNGGVPNRGIPSMVTIRAILKIVCKWLLAAAVIAGVLSFVAGRIRAYYRVVDSEFVRGQYAAMIRRINRRLLRGLRLTGGMPKAYPTDGEYCEALKRRFPGIPACQWDKFMEIVKEAAFSGSRIEKEKAQICKEIYKKVRLFRK